MTNGHDRRDLTIEQARRELAVVEAKVRDVILVMTVEQALKAQRVVREAGHRR